jgi:hypothetical protein
MRLASRRRAGHRAAAGLQRAAHRAQIGRPTLTRAAEPVLLQAASQVAERTLSGQSRQAPRTTGRRGHDPWESGLRRRDSGYEPDFGVVVVHDHGGCEHCERGNDHSCGTDHPDQHPLRHARIVALISERTLRMGEAALARSRLPNDRKRAADLFESVTALYGALGMPVA